MVLSADILSKTKVLILAAGFGTRLRPLTDTVPKPLIEVGGRSLLARHLERISRVGFSDVWINLHHLPSKIKDFVGDGARWSLKVNFSFEPEILDTGGALGALRDPLQSGSVLVINADSLFLDEIDVGSLLVGHFSSKNMPLATLVVRQDENVQAYGSLGLDGQNRVIRFLGEKSPDFLASNEMKEVMYCGIMLLSPEVFSVLPQRQVFSLTKDVLAPAVGGGKTVMAFEYHGRWFDVGTPERLHAAREVAL